MEEDDDDPTIYPSCESRPKRPGFLSIRTNNNISSPSGIRKTESCPADACNQFLLVIDGFSSYFNGK